MDIVKGMVPVPRIMLQYSLISYRLNARHSSPSLINLTDGFTMEDVISLERFLNGAVFNSASLGQEWVSETTVPPSCFFI
jgi:hypothetical protein